MPLYDVRFTTCRRSGGRPHKRATVDAASGEEKTTSSSTGEAFRPIMLWKGRQMAIYKFAAAGSGGVRRNVCMPFTPSALAKCTFLVAACMYKLKPPKWVAA